MTESENTPMITKADRKRMLTTNVLLWFVGALLHPLSYLLPTSSGEPPKILGLLIPLMFIQLAWVSTYLLHRAIGRIPDE